MRFSATLDSQASLLVVFYFLDLESNVLNSISIHISASFDCVKAAHHGRVWKGIERQIH
jgi:hypothetical protein